MLAPLKSVTAVIFDMDGVLFYSTDSHRLAYEQTLFGVGIKDFHYPDVAGMRTDEAFKLIFDRAKRPLSQPELEALVNEKRERALSAFNSQAKLAPTGKKLITDLRQRHYRVALASSASPTAMEFFLSRCGYRDLFQSILNGLEVKEAKPSPHIYLEAARLLKVKPQECLVVEDSRNGIRAALSAGMRVIGLTGTETTEELTATGAHFVVQELEAVGTLLP